MHHRNHDHEFNPPDGSNWELLCVYCHDNEHSRYTDYTGESAATAEAKVKAATGNPFAGVVAHVLRHRDHLETSMVSGRKQALSDDQEPVRSVPVAGWALIALTGLFMGYLVQHYDAQARTLDLFGTTLQLGESENENESEEQHDD